MLQAELNIFQILLISKGFNFDIWRKKRAALFVFDWLNIEEMGYEEPEKPEIYDKGPLLCVQRKCITWYI